jgi:hypothetical protein
LLASITPVRAATLAAVGLATSLPQGFLLRE